jgi:hypothetical protein
MKYWKLFAHPYAFGREDMPAVSSQMELTKVARDLLFSLTIESVFGLAARRTKASRSANWWGPRR